MVRNLCFGATLFCLALLLAGPSVAKDGSLSPRSGSSKTQAVDRLFAQWTKPDTAGAVVAIVQDGKIIYSRGYGMANLEYDEPNTPATVFHLASVSKQFTAFAIYLLAQDGKLSLDDDVRKYLPQLHDFGKTVTLRELLHHTSGVRDQWNLLALGGWRLDDEITDADVSRLLFRQTELNFPPGDQFLYSNSGYTLLAMVVQRVSGMPLPEFAQKRIFQPLGMTHTHFQANYRLVVKNRAYSYAPGDDGRYKYIALSYSTVGPSSLFSTVGDLARWDENFYSGQVGGRALLSDMQIKGKLNNGKEIPYASGLIIEKYRGLNTVSHSGGDAGYRTNILRFPDQHFSVIVLANAGDMDPPDLSLRIADIYLKDRLDPAPAKLAPSKKPQIEIDPKLLEPYLGDYEIGPGVIFTFTRENGQLVSQVTGQSKVPLLAASNTRFHPVTIDADIEFDGPVVSGKVQSGVIHQGGQSVRFKRIDIPLLTPAQLKPFEGKFYSDELGVIYEIKEKDGVLTVGYPRGEMALQPSGKAMFAADFPIGLLKFNCDEGGGCNAFTLDSGRVQKLRFVKVAITPIAAK